MNTFAMSQPADTEYQFKGKTVSIPVKYIITAAYLYMVVPIIIFFMTWLRWYVGIPTTAIFLFGGWHLLKDVFKSFNARLLIPIRELIISGVIIFAWVYTTTIFFYQTWDQHWRNALFRDMCNYEWPVVYDTTGNALVYYLMHWIVPALFGKLAGFTIANIVLCSWNALGVFLAFLCINAYIMPKKKTQIWIILVVLISWGGLNDLGYMWIDILGQGNYLLGNGFGWPDMYYGYGYQYTPNDALLAWVYNQTIAPWIGTILFMLCRRVSHYAFLGLCILPYGPIPFVGLVIFLVVDFVSQLIVKKHLEPLKEALSIPNICASISIFPVFLLFFKCNVSAQHVGFYAVPDPFGIKHLIFLAVFYLLEFGTFCLIIRRDYKHSILFYTMIVSLIIIPHVQLGFGRDFCMRASIPALFILMIFVIRYLIKNGYQVGISITIIALTICLSITGLGTLKDWANKIKSVRMNAYNPVVADDIGTFSDKQVGDVDWLENFLVPNYDRTAFFKYVAR